jgi:pentatricopeptide repeat domain-containing protein 1
VKVEGVPAEQRRETLGFALSMASKRGGNPSEMLRLFQMLKDKNWLRHCPTHTFSGVISACGKSRMQGRAFDVFADMKLAGVRPDVFTYSAMIAVCASSGSARKALQLLDEMKTAGLEPNVVTYSSLVSACGKGRMLKEALAVLDEMKQVGVTPNEQTFNSLISACGKVAKPDVAFEMLAAMKAGGLRPNEFTFNALISACAKGRRQKEAFAVFEDMKAAGVSPTVLTYNTLISAQLDEKPYLIEDDAEFGVLRGARLDTGALNSALDILQDMKVAGIAPDVATYNHLIHICKRSIRPDQAIDLFNEMKTAGLTPDVFTWNALASACRVGRQEVSTAPANLQDQNVLDSSAGAFYMKSYAVDASVEAYNAMISVYTKQGQAKNALAVFEEMKEARLVPDTVTFNALIIACRDAGKVDVALELFREMNEAGLTVTSFTFFALVSAVGQAALGQRGALPAKLKALEVFDAVQRCEPAVQRQWQQWMCSMDGYTQNIVLNMCKHGGNVERAISIFNYLLATGMEVSARLYIDFLSACEQQGRIEDIFDTFRSMHTSVDVPAYTAMIALCERFYRADLALKLFREMQSSGVQPEVATFNALITACDSSGRLDDALAVFTEMNSSALRPNEQSYSAMMSVYGKCGRADHASMLFDDMKAANIQPTGATYSALINACDAHDCRYSPIDKAVSAFQEAVGTAGCFPLATIRGHKIDLQV